MPHADDASSTQKLEEQLAFQQHALDELHSVVLTQQQELEALRREIARLTAAVEQIKEQGWGEDLPHEKPPHY
ncbi:MAG: SlyX family protein [Planctomycetota bacterium]